MIHISTYRENVHGGIPVQKISLKLSNHDDAAWWMETPPVCTTAGVLEYAMHIPTFVFQVPNY